MDAASPYRPGFNQPPPLLAGRESALANAEEAMAIVAGEQRTPPPLILVGSRGVGKTVLLGEIASRAGASYGWPWVHVEVRPKQPFASLLITAALGAESLLAESSDTDPSPKPPLRVTDTVLRAQMMGVGGEVHFSRDRPPAADAAAPGVAAVLTRLMDAAAQRSTGIVLTVDEAQLAKRGEFADFAAAFQRGTGMGWPVVVVIAGLPDLATSSRMPTYFERADWWELGMLDEAATVAALAEPARGAGRPFEPGAAELLAERTGGYPYAIQLYGHHAWRASRGQDTITVESATTAASTAKVQFEEGFFARRWARLPANERRYLLAVAGLLADEGEASGGAVARRLGVTTPQLASYRDRLIKRGILVAEGRQLRFAMPAMAGYVLEQS